MRKAAVKGSRAVVKGSRAQATGRAAEQKSCGEGNRSRACIDRQKTPRG